MKDVLFIKAVDILSRDHIDFGIPFPVQCIQCRELCGLPGSEIIKIFQQNIHEANITMANTFPGMNQFQVFFGFFQSEEAKMM